MEVGLNWCQKFDRYFRSRENDQVIKLLSLFSGIGAFEKAMRNLAIDHETVAFSEIDIDAENAYCAMHNMDKLKNIGDISVVNVASIPDCDLMTWGFPCQDISVAGQHQGLGEGTRSGLYQHGLRILDAKRPKYSIIENVKNLVGKKYKDKFDTLLSDLSNLGYTSSWAVLNAKDYGVPQNRERVFIVSRLGGGDFYFPPPRPSMASLTNLLEEAPERYRIKSPKVDSFIESRSGVDDPKPENRLIQIGYLGKNRQCDRVYSPNGTSVTLCGNGGGWGAKTGLYLIDGHIRRLTPRECYRLMGFDDSDFEAAVWSGSDTDVKLYRQAGNSIAVPVVQAILSVLLGVKS